MRKKRICPDPECGKVIAKTQDFCGKCGTKYVEPDEDATGEPDSVAPGEDTQETPERISPRPGMIPDDEATKTNDEDTLPGIEKVESVEDFFGEHDKRSNKVGINSYPIGGWLVEVIAGPRKGQSVSGDGIERLTIGTDEEAVLSLSGDPYASDAHAVMTGYPPMRVFAKDSGSTNGTYIKVRESIELQDGDEILIGKSLIRVTKKI